LTLDNFIKLSRVILRNEVTKDLLRSFLVSLVRMRGRGVFPDPSFILLDSIKKEKEGNKKNISLLLQFKP